MQTTRITFAFLGGALAWTLHLMLGYFFSEAACRSVLDQGSRGSMLGFLMVLTVLCLAIAIVSLMTARSLRKARSGPEDVETFMGTTSVWINAFFLLVIAAQSLPLFMGDKGC